jgi:hypothetical protein
MARPTDEELQVVLAPLLLEVLQAVVTADRTRDEAFALVRSTIDRIGQEVPA